MTAKRVHILISPPATPQLTYVEVVPDTYHQHRVVAHYKEKGWDVLVLPEDYAGTDDEA